MFLLLHYLTPRLPPALPHASGCQLVLNKPHPTAAYAAEQVAADGGGVPAAGGAA
jgi:hypothetical protein